MFVLTVLVVVMLVKDLVLGASWVSTLPQGESVYVRGLALALYYVIVMGILIVLARRRGGLAAAFSLKADVFDVRSFLTSAVLVAALLMATRAAGWAYQVVVRALGWEVPTASEVTLTGLFGPGVSGLVMAGVFVVLMAPLVEELVFRRVLLAALSRRIAAHMALVVQAMVFALFHATPWLWGPMFILGLACGWLAQTRATLYPAILLHMAYNAVLVAAVYYMQV